MQFDKVLWPIREYTKKFHSLVAQLSESYDQLVAHYLCGLRTDLNDRLSGFYFSDVPEIIPKAEFFESQLIRAGHRLVPSPSTYRSPSQIAPSMPISNSLLLQLQDQQIVNHVNLLLDIRFNLLHAMLASVITAKSQGTCRQLSIEA